MTSLPLRYFAGLLLVLFASTASSQSVIEQLTAGQKPDSNEFLGVPNAMVLTIDGIDPNMQAKGLLGLITKGPTTGGGDSYLIEHVNEKWDFADDVRYFPWSGDTADTNDYVNKLKIQIDSLAELAERREKPFVILAHSWGSVLAYRAISELKREGEIPRPLIYKLVTIGSPLGARCNTAKKAANKECIAAKSATNRYANLTGTDAVLGPVRSWTNFWIEKDVISGDIPDLSDNMELNYGFADPHQAYYNNSALFGRITDVVAKDLATFVPIAQVAESSPLPADPEPTPVATVASTDTIVIAQTESESDDSQDRSFVPLETVPPVYPTRPLSKGTEGKVLVQFDISFNGTVINPVVIDKTSSMFSRAAIRGVIKMKFAETDVAGVRTIVEFRLGGRGDGTGSAYSIPTTRQIALDSEFPRVASTAATGESKDSEPDASQIEKYSKASSDSPEIYGIRLGMLLREVISGVKSRHPEAGEGLHSVREPPVNRPLYRIERGGCTAGGYSRDQVVDCARSFRFTFRVSEYETRSLFLGFIDPYADSPRTSIVTSIKFTHGMTGGKFSFDYEQFFREKYSQYRLAAAPGQQSDTNFYVPSEFGPVRVNLSKDQLGRYNITSQISREAHDKLIRERESAIKSTLPTADEPF